MSLIQRLLHFLSRRQTQDFWCSKKIIPPDCPSTIMNYEYLYDSRPKEILGTIRMILKKFFSITTILSLIRGQAEHSAPKMVWYPSSEIFQRVRHLFAIRFSN